jgi:hypothetical protein
MKRFITIGLLVCILHTASYAIPTAEELLDKYAETADKAFSSFICQSKSEKTKNDNFAGEFTYRNGQRTVYLLQELRTDGTRLKLVNEQWGDVFQKNNSVFVPETDKGYFTYLYDGEKQYEHNRGPESAGYVLIGNELPDDKRFGMQITQGIYGAPCLGYLKGDYKRFDQILKEAGSENISVKEKMEEINGTANYVIEADTNNGKYHIWLNPEKGYNFTKAVLQKKEGDAYNYGPLRPGDDFLFQMENTEFREINGVWVPVKARMEYEYKLPNGGSSEEKINYEITSISINPDHDTLRSFLTDDIQNGAKVILREVSGINYIWQDGELIPNIDKAAIDQLDRMTEEIMAEGNKCRASLEDGAVCAAVTLDTILAEYRKTQKRLGLFYCEGAVSENDKQTTEDLYTCDGASFGVQVRAGNKVIDCFIWDGQKTMHYTSESVLASVNKQKPYQLLATVYPGSLLLGYLNGRPERVDALLSKVAKEATISEEKLNEKNCYVITAPIGKDTYRVWFSPEQGYHVVKAEVLADSKTVYLLDKVTFKKVEDVWVPAACVVKDGTRQYSYERTRIDLKPHFTAIQAFESQIIDGTGVTVEGLAGSHYWKSGRVVDKEGKDVF